MPCVCSFSLPLSLLSLSHHETDAWVSYVLQTGLLSPRSFTSLSSSFLDPLRTRLDEWLEAPQEQDRDQHVMSTRMQVEVVRELVERIDGAVETRRS